MTLDLCNGLHLYYNVMYSRLVYNNNAGSALIFAIEFCAAQRMVTHYAFFVVPVP